MAKLGFLKEEPNGGFGGVIQTPLLNLQISLEPADKEKPAQPDYRVLINGKEAGAAWRKVIQSGADAGKERLSIAIEDPVLANVWVSAKVVPGQKIEMTWEPKTAPAAQPQARARTSGPG